MPTKRLTRVSYFVDALSSGRITWSRQEIRSTFLSSSSSFAFSDDGKSRLISLSKLPPSGLGGDRTWWSGVLAGGLDVWEPRGSLGRSAVELVV